MKRKLRIELRIGLLLFAVWSVLNQFTETPHFVLGGLIGISICLMLIGGLHKAQYTALKLFKKKMLGRLKNDFLHLEQTD